MSGAIGRVLKEAAQKIEKAIGDAGKAVRKHFDDTGSGLRKSATAHAEHDASAAKDLEHAATHTTPETKPKGGSGTTPTSATPGPSVSKGWEGEGTHLDPADNAKVDAFHARATANEKDITRNIDDIVSSTPGAARVGHGYEVKGEDSLKRKIATETQLGTPIDEAVGGVNDSVRYTMTFDEKNYAEGAQNAVDELRRRGYEPIDGKFKNCWDTPGYKGINSNWVDPRTGQRFEVQFHTPTSFDVKDVQTHHMYEEARLPDTTPARRAELNRMQDELFNAIPVPHGAGSVGPGGPR